jgi:hypothetical protein
MLARLPGIDRAALGFWNDRLHDLCSPSPREGRAGAALPLGRCLATARQDLMPAVRARGCPLGSAGGASAASSETVVSLSIRRPKKRGPFPFVPGDGPSDGREAGIGCLAPDKAICNNSDGVPLALVFAQEHGAGLEPPWAIGFWFVTPRDCAEDLCHRRIWPAQRLLLDVPAEEPRDEILGEGWRWGGAERRAPQSAKPVEAE